MGLLFALWTIPLMRLLRMKTHSLAVYTKEEALRQANFTRISRFKSTVHVSCKR